MADVKIQAVDNGPLKVVGEVDILDGEGNVMDTKHQCYLCRCGLSTYQPFCSGAHLKKFESEVRKK